MPKREYVQTIKAYEIVVNIELDNLSTNITSSLCVLGNASLAKRVLDELERRPDLKAFPSAPNPHQTRLQRQADMEEDLKAFPLGQTIKYWQNSAVVFDFNYRPVFISKASASDIIDDFETAVSFLNEQSH